MSATSSNSDAAAYDVTRRTAAVLLAGRAAMRGGQWIAGVALLAIWGSETFASYAAALGLTGWLLTISASGTEKAALTLLPTRGGHVLRRRLLVIALAPLAVASICTGVAVLVAATTSWRLGVETVWPAAIYATAVGAAMVLVAMLRLNRQPAWDAAGFTTIGVAHLATIAVAQRAGVGPVGVLWLLATVAGVAALLALGGVLARPAPVERQRAPGRMHTIETVALMGSVEIVNTVGIAVLYAILHRQAPPAETSTLYIALLVSQAITGAYVYLLRLVVPRAAVRGAANPVTATTRAVVLARRTAVVGALPAVIVVVTAWYFTGTGLGRWLLVGALVVVGVAVFAAVSYASLRLETRDAGGRRVAAAAALAGMASVVLAGFVLVGRSGAVGALAAMLAGSVVHAAALWLIARRRGVATTPGPV